MWKVKLSLNYHSVNTQGHSVLLAISYTLSKTCCYDSSISFPVSQWVLYRDLSVLIGFKYKGCHSRCLPVKTLLVFVAECGTTTLLSEVVKVNEAAACSTVGGPQPNGSGWGGRWVWSNGVWSSWTLQSGFVWSYSGQALLNTPVCNVTGTDRTKKQLQRVLICPILEKMFEMSSLLNLLLKSNWADSALPLLEIFWE